MTTKKVILGATLALGLSLFSQPSLEVNADTNLERDWLTFEEIDQKFEEINGKYDIGEEMNIEDQEFVKKYADKPMLGISGKRTSDTIRNKKFY